MLGNFKKNKQFILLTIILVMIGAITNVITPIMIQYYNEKSIQVSYRIMMLIFLSMFISFLLQIIMVIFRENFASKFNVHYLFQLINKLTQVKYDTFLEKEPSYLINRILTSVDTLYLFLISSFPSIIKSLFIIVVSLVCLFIMSWKISIALFILLPLNFFGYKHINKKLAIKMEVMQKNAAVANKDLIVSLSNIDNVKSQANDQAIETLLKPQIENMYNTLANTNKYAQVSSTSLSFINQVTQNLTYIWTSIMIVNQSMPVGNLIILSILVPMYYSALSDLSKVNIDFKSLEISNVFLKKELVQNVEEDGHVTINEIASINFSNPSFEFENQQFNYHLSDTLERGDIVYLDGHSGSGKTSLLRLLLKFRKSKGIKINGEQIETIKNASLRQNIAYISQDPLILSTTLENNIGMGKKLSDTQKNFIENSKILAPIFKTKNWETVLYENGANLSGGEKQRIAICRMIINEADLYILDESISNIDLNSANEIMNFLVNNISNKIIIYTSHDKQFIKFSNKILHL